MCCKCDMCYKSAFCRKMRHTFPEKGSTFAPDFKKRAEIEKKEEGYRTQDKRQNTIVSEVISL